MKWTHIFTVLMSLVLFCSLAHAQDFSNKGKDFWLCYPAHIDGTNSRMALYISSDASTTGSVNVAGTVIPFSVTANQATVVPISPVTYNVLNSQNEGTNTGRAIHVTAAAPVVVYAHILNAARSGSSLILPTNTLGREYTAVSFRSMSNATPPNGVSGGSASGSQFTIVGVENNTTVEITPSVTDVNGSRPAGVPFTVNLNQGDVYQFRSTFSNDITGTKIRSLATSTTSCKPIAVFSGSSWTAMDCNNSSGGDNLFQQLMPRNTWGRNYVTAPFADRSYDIFRVIVNDPTTIVTVNGSPLPTSTLINNTYYQFSSSSANVVATDKPVMVVQYMVSQTCDTRNGSNTANPAFPGDPEMVILNPVEQTINDVTVVSARRDLIPPQTNITKHFFTLIMKSNATASLRIDGLPPTGVFIPIGASGYSYLHEDVTASTNSNPSHRIRADSGFIALAYGLGNVESYGYNAGTNVKDLYQFITLQNQNAIVNFPSGCVGTPFTFAMTFPYQPTNIQWQFGGLFNDTTLTNPVLDSTWVVDGRQLYRYKLTRTYLINTVGVYPIKVLATNPTPDGCSGLQEINYDLNIIAKPRAGFTFATDGCATSAVQFTDTSTGGRPQVNWSWNFGGAGSSNIKNPSFTFPAAGVYPVSFSYLNDIGCRSDTVTKNIVLTPPPVARFGVSTPLCVGKTVTFSDSSTVNSGTLTKWTWNFGNGNAPVVATTNANQVISYATTGTFNATLQVETSTGCKSTVTTLPVTINPNPVPNFTFGNACLPGGTMQFTNTSTIADGTQAQFQYQWNFGNNTTSAAANPTATYTATGPVNASLVVTSGAGCKDSVTKAVNTIYPQPVALFDAPAQICLGQSISLRDSSTAPNSNLTQWQWNFGDGNTATQQNPTHTYTAAGTYFITLTATSAIGCVSTVARDTIVVNALPTAGFSLSSPLCETRTVTFTNTSLANSGSIVKWTWNFDNGSGPVVVNSTSPQTATYAATGTYNVTLQVETDRGCISSITTNPVTINPLPKPGFIMPDNCLSDPFSQFTDTSTIADGSQNAFTYLWNFNDPNATAANPNTSTVKNGRHRFIQTGNYNVRLTVTSDKGCADSVTQSFTMNGTLPLSGFTINGGNTHCSNRTVSITNNSSVDIGSVVRIEIFWDFANDPTNKVTISRPATGAVFSHTYPEFFTPFTQTRQVRVVAYSGDACFNQLTQTITLQATPEIQFDTIQPVCADVPTFSLNQATVINILPGNGVYSGRGVTSSGSFNPATAGVGRHTIRYTYTGTNGCSTFREMTAIVFPVPTANAGADRFVLEGGSVQIMGSGSGNGISFLWTPPAALNNRAVAQPMASPSDDITYRLLVTSSDGCTATDDVFVSVLKAPVIPNVFTPNGDGINDRWEIKYLESYPGASIEIFNRYGQKVYESIGYSRPWDGTVKGNPLPAGTYYYIINPKNGRKQMAGFVDILR